VALGLGVELAAAVGLTVGVVLGAGVVEGVIVTVDPVAAFKLLPALPTEVVKVAGS